METIECKDLMSWVSKLENSHGLSRAQAVWDFAADCCSGVKSLSKDTSRLLNGKTKKAGTVPDQVVALLQSVANDVSISDVLPALEAVRGMPGVKLFRGELYSEMRRALTEYSAEDGPPLQECALVVRERTRQFGRSMAPRVVSRTLLIKGLEFDNCMVIGADKLDRNNLYVALTRASRTLIIVSHEPLLQPQILSA